MGAYGPLVGKAQALAQEARAFHWPLEFPDVMASGGFDAAGAEKLFRENVSSVAPRKQLEAAIEFAREVIPWLSRKLTAWRARSGICAKSLIGCRRRASLCAS
jgi:hypothetical protein